MPQERRSIRSHPGHPNTTQAMVRCGYNVRHTTEEARPMTVPYAPPNSDLEQAVDGLFSLSRRLTDVLAITIEYVPMPDGIGTDYDAAARTLRIRDTAPLPAILHALYECWRLVVLGPEYTTATHRPHLHLVEPRRPLD